VVRAGGQCGAANSSRVSAAWRSLGLAPAQQTPEALGSLHRAEIEGWWPIIRAAVINAN
jgi:hypothetical protein